MPTEEKEKEERATTKAGPGPQWVRQVSRKYGMMESSEEIRREASKGKNKYDDD